MDSFIKYFELRGWVWVLVGTSSLVSEQNPGPSKSISLNLMSGVSLTDKSMVGIGGASDRWILLIGVICWSRGLEKMNALCVCAWSDKMDSIDIGFVGYPGWEGILRVSMHSDGCS